MATVDIHDVHKSYNKKMTIHGVSIKVPDGAFVALVGPSGCGKSTLLRMIAGLEEITSGEISIDGNVINDVEPKHRDIAMVFQNYALYPHMTIAQNMGFSLRLAKKSKQEIAEAVEAAAAILGLSDYLERYPRELSGGQRQRVAMGRAIVRAPQVFLFDEPLSNLDAKLRVQMRAELKQLHARLRATTIYVTHDQVEALTLADQVVVMREGRIEQSGRPLALYDHPANIFVASFIGSPAMNLLEGRVEGNEGKQRFVSSGGTTLTLGPDMPNTIEGHSVTLGIRPEHLTVDENHGELHLNVEIVEPTGSETQITGVSGTDSIVAVLRDRLEVLPGKPLQMSCAVGNLHLFDTETGQRMN